MVRTTQIVTEETCCLHMGYSFRLTARLAHTTTFITPVVEHWLERETAQWVHPTKNRSDDPSHHEQTLLPRSYISLRTEGNGPTCTSSWSRPKHALRAQPPSGPLTDQQLCTTSHWNHKILNNGQIFNAGARCRSVVRAFVQHDLHIGLTQLILHETNLKNKQIWRPQWAQPC